ncbi:MAG: dephospho-CoA kinase, partial [Clostridia bacterium]|nr:dephospho-CoA kinase [Clostridia bacterium]
MNKAVAVVGMCGSGKSVLCDYFVKMGWQSVYFGGVTVKQLKKRGIEVNEQNERAMRESLRANYGMGAFAVLL